MVARAVAKLTAPLRRRVMLMVRMGVLKLVGATSKTQELQVAVFDGETLARVKHLLPYGFNVHPHVGSEVVLIFPAGNTSNPIAVVVGGRDHRPTDLMAGEVELYDDQGQRVTLRRDRIDVRSPFRVRLEAPVVEVNSPDIRLAGGGPRVARVGDRVEVGGGSSAGLWPIVEGSGHVTAGG